MLVFSPGIKTVHSLRTNAYIETLDLRQCSVSGGYTTPSAARCPYPLICIVTGRPISSSHRGHQQPDVAPSDRCDEPQVDKLPRRDGSRRDAVHLVGFLTLQFVR